MPHIASSRRWLALAALGLYWIILFVLTHLPGDPRPAPPEVRILPVDKIAHAAAFAGLAFLACVAAAGFRLVTPLVLLCLAAVLAGYAAIDELTQGWIRFRVPDYRDWVADMLGMAAGFFVFFVARRWRQTRTQLAATSLAVKS
jgi:VanZ family protein